MKPALAWGRTGRVTLQECWDHNDGTNDRTVLVDGKDAGRVIKRLGPDSSWFVGGLASFRFFPSRDAAVMWVLAHARGDGTPADRKRIRDVWRAERSDPVWAVWAVPVPADPFGPAGWQWYADPTVWICETCPNVCCCPPRFADGPSTPERGHRTAIRLAAHTAARYERTHP